MSRILKYGLWLPVAVAVASCGVPRTYYYTIEMPRVTKERAVPVDRRVFVQRFSADRRIAMDDLDEASRARRRLERDIRFVESILEGIGVAREVLTECLSRLDAAIGGP